MVDLYRINLNLLVALDVLLQEKNVTRAAAKVCLTQAAMSNNLKQLRTIFNDKLLTSEKNYSVLTSYAKELRQKLHRVLEELDSIITTNQSFNPATCNRMFNLGMADFYSSDIYPTLIGILEREAPNIKINTIAVTQMYHSSPFENGEYDIGIGRVSPLPSYIHKQLIKKEEVVCLLSADHPLAKKEAITLSEYQAYKHIYWRTHHPNSSPIIDVALETYATKFDTILYLPYLDSVFRLIEKSNSYFAAIIESAARLCLKKYNCVIKPFPVKSPEFESYVVWHARFDDDLAHQWLRNQIIGLFSAPESCD